MVAGQEAFAVERTFWALLLLAVLVIGYLGVGLVVAAQLSAPSHHPQELTPTDVGLDYREVSIHSTDGLELAGGCLLQDGVPTAERCPLPPPRP